MNKIKIYRPRDRLYRYHSSSTPPHLAYVILCISCREIVPLHFKLHIEALPGLERIILKREPPSKVLSRRSKWSALRLLGEESGQPYLVELIPSERGVFMDLSVVDDDITDISLVRLLGIRVNKGDGF